MIRVCLSFKDFGFINFVPPPKSEDCNGQPPLPTFFFAILTTHSIMDREIERTEIVKVKRKLQPVVN
jgi:hypothetical protein